MEPIHLRVGRNLQTIRKQRELSLDKAAALTGVSKAMLGQIERGETNPTVGILWKIAQGLQVSFTAFMEEDLQDVVVVRLSDAQPVTEEDGRYRVYPLFPYRPGTPLEVFRVELEPGSSHHAEAHPKGLKEYIVVTSGTLRFTAGGQSYDLSAGEALCFKADRPHVYHNPGEATAYFQNVLYYEAP
ncbi:DNA-binding protein [Paenibacillus mucilaginosus 3016]|uniref:DNA-binding protein n=2 Tax=Paenibacillus mucilaginosus TaxID=61624 RepID=H6NE72_9BACL|nr:XRE family transcriptional regulator [Paenibacillus mucilaginosus]AFC33848.1 DNA-binding protein [Paenibacillus mucilaginosus 3016]AFH66174.1 DNA-binding protein [Paenibacillus mucilaginosus K02]WFA22232.1 XRE family transcriptional regulator [Paenibacillus mucilaginosus]